MKIGRLTVALVGRQNFDFNPEVTEIRAFLSPNFALQHSMPGQRRLQRVADMLLAPAKQCLPLPLRLNFADFLPINIR
ncbi:MAG: hypothetical protein U1F55_06070 [Chitinivorax sp.]